MVQDVWAVGDSYEAYVGRWSRLVSKEFLRRLDRPADGRWLDVGCGTGALTQSIVDGHAPARVVGVDPSAGFLGHARSGLTDSRVAFVVGDARALPAGDGLFDAVVSGLCLNFVPDPSAAAGELARVAAPGGVVSAYVWDYADGMTMMRYFWDAAAALDTQGEELDEGRRFPLCQPEPLRQLWTDAGLTDVSVEPVEVPTHFADFDDYWSPFLGGQGAAPAYLVSLPPDLQEAVRERVRAALPVETDGSIRLTARAWAVRGCRPTQPRSI